MEYVHLDAGEKKKKEEENSLSAQQRGKTEIEEFLREGMNITPEHYSPAHSTKKWPTHLRKEKEIKKARSVSIISAKKRGKGSWGHSTLELLLEGWKRKGNGDAPSFC